MDLGGRLKELREKRGMRQLELARASTVSQSMISQIEGGKRPKPGAEILSKLEGALDVPIGYLSTPEATDESLKEFFESDYARDMEVTPDEKELLAEIPWKGPLEKAPPSAWASLLDAIRKKNKAKK